MSKVRKSVETIKIYEAGDDLGIVAAKVNMFGDVEVTGWGGTTKALNISIHRMYVEPLFSVLQEIIGDKTKNKT